MSSIEIKEYKFEKEELKKLKEYKYGYDWPITYIIRNEKDAYIGESTNAYKRMTEHIRDRKRKKLKVVNIIANNKFNLSTTKDIESKLIRYMSADEKYSLQNKNEGLVERSYYDKKLYQEIFMDIWKDLRQKSIVNKGHMEIENSNLFKFSPFTTLTNEQNDIRNNIIKNIINKKIKTSKYIIEGGPGTGKTVLAVSIVKRLQEISDESHKRYKIGLVIPMQSFRETLKKVFRDIPGLNSKMVIKPAEVFDKNNKKYDILIVDESHRLSTRKNQANGKVYNEYDEICNGLGIDPKEATQLDWIEKCSKNQIIFYDEKQKIRSNDIDIEIINKFKKRAKTYKLNIQKRCKGGKKYIEFINNIFSNKYKNTVEKNFEDYEFEICDDLSKMIKKIKEKNRKYGLSRTVSGFFWKWNRKKPNEVFEYNGEKLIWNRNNKDWINSKDSINEIGCIHTIQGYELNYCGIIVGEELDYDFEKEEFIVDRKKYKDIKGKSNVKNDKELTELILNTYSVMATRAIYGSYLYICNDNLRKYIRNKIKEVKENKIYKIQALVAEESEEYKLEKRRGFK